jgi:hypothetical protein
MIKMTNDYIAELALIDISRAQREAEEKIRDDTGTDTGASSDGIQEGGGRVQLVGDQAA